MAISKPSTLSARASEVWDRTVKAANHLTASDHDVLVAYCETVARHERACEQITDLVSETTKGTLQIAPEVRLARDEAAAVRQLAHELNLTPATRGEAAVKEAENRLDELRQRRKDKLAS